MPCAMAGDSAREKLLAVSRVTWRAVCCAAKVQLVRCLVRCLVRLMRMVLMW